MRVRACVRACTSRNNSIFKELYYLFADAGCRYSELTAVAGASGRCSAFLAAHSSASKSPTLLPLSPPGICYWLPVCQRVVFKIAGLVHQSLVGLAPAYLADDCRLLSDIGCRQPIDGSDVTGGEQRNSSKDRAGFGIEASFYLTYIVL